MSKEATHCLSIFAFIIVIVLVYMWYDGQIVSTMLPVSPGTAAVASSFTVKKKGFKEGELDKHLNNKREGMADYDPSSGNVALTEMNSHQDFVNTAYAFSHGTNSTDVLRTDTQEVNPRWGLSRVDYTTAFSADDARTVSSETPDQLKQKTGTYIL